MKSIADSTCWTTWSTAREPNSPSRSSSSTRFDRTATTHDFDELIEHRKRFEVEAAEWAEANGPWLP